MLMTIEELRQFITTDKTDLVLDAQLKALELLIRKYTNNNFQDRNRRFRCNVSSQAVCSMHQPYSRLVTLYRFQNLPLMVAYIQLQALI